MDFKKPVIIGVGTVVLSVVSFFAGRGYEHDKAVYNEISPKIEYNNSTIDGIYNNDSWWMTKSAQRAAVSKIDSLRKENIQLTNKLEKETWFPKYLIY